MEVEFKDLVQSEKDVRGLRAAYEDDIRRRIAALEAQVEMLRNLVIGSPVASVLTKTTICGSVHAKARK